ncbi:hypothetical protein D3C74_268690 [compost metagenome]
MLRAPGHRTAGIHNVAFQRHDSEAVLQPCRHLVRSFQIAGKDDVAEQAADDIRIPRLITDQFCADSDESVRLFQLALVRRGNLARTDDVQWQKCCTAQLPLLQESDRLPRYGFVLHDDMLHSGAQRRFYGQLKLFRNSDQFGDRAMYSG